MPELTKKPPIKKGRKPKPLGNNHNIIQLNIEITSDTLDGNEPVEVALIGPKRFLKQLLQLARLMDFEDADESISTDYLIAQVTPGMVVSSYRQREGLNQNQLAKKIGSTESCISLIEQDKKPVSKAMAVKLSKILRFHPNELDAAAKRLQQNHPKRLSNVSP